MLRKRREEEAPRNYINYGRGREDMVSQLLEPLDNMQAPIQILNNASPPINNELYFLSTNFGACRVETRIQHSLPPLHTRRQPSDGGRLVYRVIVL